MAEAAFSEDGKYYSAISQDGRLRIWDTETNVLKQEYTPDLHLTSPPSCLQWITVATSSGTTQKKKRKSSVSGSEAQCIAIGTTSGKILLYSVAQAKVETVLEDKNIELSQNKKVACMDWSRKEGLFSCNKNSLLTQWRLETNKKYRYKVSTDNANKQVSTVSAIKIIPHSVDTTAQFIITASWQLRVWRLNEGSATSLKCLGHNTSQQSILAIAATSDKTWVIEGSRTERLLSFWDVTITSDAAPQTNGEEPTPKKKQRRKSIANDVQTVNVPTYNFVLEDAPKMIDVVVKEEGETTLTLAAVTRSGVMHYYMHTFNGASAKPIKPSVTIHTTTAGGVPLPLVCCRLAPALLAGYSRGAALVFETITPDLSSKTQVLIRDDDKPKKGKAGDASKPADSVQYVEPAAGRKRMAPGAKLEVPMEARLANLALDTAARDRSAVAHNLTRLLVQGLHSKDQGILEMVLQHTTKAAASRTVAQLPAEYVPPFLDQLNKLAAKRTNQCASVCMWVGALLRSHAALLLATMNTHHADQLTKLLATFTNRRSHLCQLLNLKGRLDLTLSQRVAKDNTAGEQEAIIDYNDTSEEEMELERQSAASDASWADGHFESDGDSDGNSDGGGSEE